MRSNVLRMSSRYCPSRDTLPTQLRIRSSAVHRPCKKGEPRPCICLRGMHTFAELPITACCSTCGRIVTSASIDTASTPLRSLFRVGQMRAVLA